MSAKIIDGKSIARKIYEEIKPQIEVYCPTLAIIQIGDDPGSSVYRRSIEKRASKSVSYTHLTLPTILLV